VEKFPTQDDVQLGQQRPGVDHKCLTGAANALLMEAVCAAVLWLAYEGFRLCMK
jgi:hypothetical protein